MRPTRIGMWTICIFPFSSRAYAERIGKYLALFSKLWSGAPCARDPIATQPCMRQSICCRPQRSAGSVPHPWLQTNWGPAPSFPRHKWRTWWKQNFRRCASGHWKAWHGTSSKQLAIATPAHLWQGRRRCCRGVPAPRAPRAPRVSVSQTASPKTNAIAWPRGTRWCQCQLKSSRNPAPAVQVAWLGTRSRPAGCKWVVPKIVLQT